MSILERVQSVAENLTRAEQKLVREIIAKPRDVALGTASSLAQRIGVHEATASRLAKKLGFESYAGFRDAIRDEFIVKTDPALRVRNTLEAAQGGDLLSELIAREIEALGNLPNYIDARRIEQAAEVLIRARRVFIFARGNAVTLGVMLEKRLLRMGLDVEILSGDSRDLAEQVLRMSDEDALIAFAFRRQPRHYAALVERARVVGATSISISGSLGPALAPAPDMLLSAPRSGSNDSFQTLTVPMAITNALVLTMAQKDQTKALERLETLGELINEFESR
ncbi:MurR/RpiR family transcriptional regulator [Pelagibacterium sp. 26DY04]|uniref:MurR/RpiR family transcriptional regulator n=1 Tax=Pelagibacterium sp. 26DY04 TaxID=2967130 RepID=UPI002815B86C|nr:MurR/RpiR family transcriptional regulator [Pelagibacterium sp. 26DY04]WMT87526.1 MurR/RpiR family transcriptional regulator [Pelagibacterium sp. 26DY04]